MAEEVVRAGDIGTGLAIVGGKLVTDLSSVSLNVTTQPLYEYRTFWAEENGAVANNSFEWSFGNGSTGAIGLPFEAGWEITQVFMQSEVSGTSLQVDFLDTAVVNTAAAPVLFSITHSAATWFGAGGTNRASIVDLSPVVILAADSIIAPYTRTEVGIFSDVRVGFNARRQIGDYVSAVSVA